ncbi:hypothetical protein AWH62_09700 [Maricaulis sp. W15]|uniref:hypothetical protein n=1 Tax=Maricaulis sp. W15 TaxID=1772333 RepID=UPI000948E28A|nr:hypothetical protein [Maricaulis sp. W15]OLF73201.1 hypothetical protein AWH62_09700 [Maricaulis sp. W15]
MNEVSNTDLPLEEARLRVIWEQISGQIQKEAGLIYSWLTILVIVNAALFAAMVNLDFDQLVNAANDGNVFNPEAVVLLLISFAGILSTSYFFFAIEAASEQFQVLRTAYLAKADAFNALHWPTPYGDENETWITGWRAPIYWVVGKPRIVPLSFITVWLVILIYVVGGMAAA